MTTCEFQWIQQFFKPLTENNPEALNLDDDVACLILPPQHQLILSTDTSIEDIHFTRHASPQQIASKSFLSALSDLVAKGARPHGYLMNFSKPSWVDEPWMTAFTNTLQQLQNTYGLTILGGDTTHTQGPLVITITPLGYVSSEKGPVLRSTAQAGDSIYVTGFIGDSGLYLKAQNLPLDHIPQDIRHYFEARHFCPRLPLEFMRDSCHLWSAAIDLSDGLLADINHMAKSSDLCAHIDLETVPFSPQAHEYMKHLGSTPLNLATSGEDFELAIAVSPHHAADLKAVAARHQIPFHPVGHFHLAEESKNSLRIYAQGIEQSVKKLGYHHF